MTPAELFRSQRPKAVDAAMYAAQGEYLAMFARLAERGEKVAATIALVACRAESRTAPSPNPPACDCETCRTYLFNVRWKRIAGVS